jgi:hypothetical protein
MEININSLINVLTSILRMYSLLYWPGIFLRKIYRSSDKRYARDNRLMNLESSYWWVCLAPRCRLITSWWCTIYQGFGCSPIKVIRELGSERRETVWSLSTVLKKNKQQFTLVREDREELTSDDQLLLLVVCWLVKLIINNSWKKLN